MKPGKYTQLSYFQIKVEIILYSALKEGKKERGRGAGRQLWREEGRKGKENSVGLGN